MTTKLLMSCDGCHIKTTSEKWFSRTFRSFDGKGWGLGVWEETEAKDIVPNGWILMDPYTGCTYCPKCWAEIEAGDETAKAI